MISACAAVALDTRITGRLTVQGGPTIRDMPRLVGTVNTDLGTFRAYGQDLQIESGRIAFAGAPGNPSIDIVAVRRNINVRVGVRLYGTAQQPLVKLFSEPAMPDSERLSWLVLGRSSYDTATRPCCNARLWPCSAGRDAASADNWLMHWVWMMSNSREEKAWRVAACCWANATQTFLPGLRKRTGRHRGHAVFLFGHQPRIEAARTNHGQQSAPGSDLHRQL